MMARGLLAAAVLASSVAAQAVAAPRVVYSAYKHLAQGRGADHVIRDAQGQPYAQAGREALTWAFATGECGSEVWGDEQGDDVARANVAAFDAARVGYIISTGGQGGVFTCATDEGMNRFITRYASPQLIGIDFDIEAGQSAAQIDSLVQRAKNAGAKWPTLRFSFTIATHAGADGSLRSLNATGEAILAAIRRIGLDDYVLNLMVMDYGVPDLKFCVVKAGGSCDMGGSAAQAARNVNARYGVPFANIELTPMIGENDVPNNTFTVADAALVADAVKSLHLAGLHYWSLDRDRPCPAPVTGASPLCSGLPQPPGAFAHHLF
jgi:hypothetical protein